MPELSRLRRALHARPELAFTEIETAATVIAELSGVADSIAYGEPCAGWTALLVCLHRKTSRRPGNGHSWRVFPQSSSRPSDAGARGSWRRSSVLPPGPTVAIRFDMDALPVTEHEEPEHFPAQQGFASTRPGIMHACGHDGHVAIGIELGRRLAADRAFPGQIRLLFQPAEEGSRGAVTMLEAGVTRGVDILLGLHVGIDLPLGTVAASAEGVMATEKWRVVFTGNGAHAALAPHEGRNALLGACSAALALHGLPPYPGATTRVNVGRLEAGTTVNIVPARATLECELRADDDTVLSQLTGRARAALHGAAAMHLLEVSVERSGRAAVAHNDAPVVETMVRAAAGIPDVQQVHRSAPMRASDDVTLFMADVQAQGVG